MSTFIEVRDLEKDYHLGDEFVHALAGASLDLPNGEFAGSFERSDVQFPRVGYPRMTGVCPLTGLQARSSRGAEE